MSNLRCVKIEVLLDVLNFALKYVDFNSISLTQDLHPKSITIDSISFEFINYVILKMFSLRTQNKVLNAKQVESDLGLNSDDWSIIVKYTFQNTAIITKDNPVALKNWTALSKTILSMCVDDVISSSIPQDIFIQHCHFPEISEVFKRFIGQCLLDKNDAEAECLHLMLHFMHQIVINKNNGMKSIDVADKVATYIFDGLQINDNLNSENSSIKKTRSFGDSDSFDILNSFKVGLNKVIFDSFFLKPFSKALYIDYYQNYDTLNEIQLEKSLSQTSKKKSKSDKSKVDKTSKNKSIVNSERSLLLFREMGMYNFDEVPKQEHKDKKPKSKSHKIKIKY